MIIVLVGKAGSGKTSILNELAKKYKKIVTYTTRPQRNGEVDGVDYHFISKEEFETAKKNGEFLEDFVYRTNQGDWYYGSKYKDYNDDSIIILTPKGLEKLNKTRIKKYVVSVYIKSSDDILFNRMIERGDDFDEVIRRRLNDKKDFTCVNTNFVIENNGNCSVEEIANVIDYLCRKH